MNGQTKASRNGLLVRYVVCGVCTALLNTLVYEGLYRWADVGNALSCTVAWLLAVIAAFLGNKYLVFRVRRKERGAILREIAEFFGCRVATGLLDVGIMLVAVDLLGWNSLLWKVLSNGVVTVTNYAVSRFRIFTEK